MKSNKSRNEWEQLVSEYNKSGLSLSVFSKSADIKPTTFIYWVKKFNKPILDVPKLVKLKTQPILSTSNIQIAIDQVKLEIPGTMASDKISKLITAIREVI